MEPIKISENVEFEVIYADGTRKRVREGVLFEAEDKTITFHNGTDRPEVMYVAAEIAARIVCEMGLKKLLLKRIKMQRRTPKCHINRESSPAK